MSEMRRGLEEVMDQQAALMPTDVSTRVGFFDQHDDDDRDVPARGVLQGDTIDHRRSIRTWRS